MQCIRDNPKALTSAFHLLRTPQLYWRTWKRPFLKWSPNYKGAACAENRTYTMEQYQSGQTNWNRILSIMNFNRHVPHYKFVQWIQRKIWYIIEQIWLHRWYMSSFVEPLHIPIPKNKVLKAVNRLSSVHIQHICLYIHTIYTYNTQLSCLKCFWKHISSKLRLLTRKRETINYDYFLKTISNHDLMFQFH